MDRSHRSTGHSFAYLFATTLINLIGILAMIELTVKTTGRKPSVKNPLNPSQTKVW